MSCYHKIVELLVSLLDYVNMKEGGGAGGPRGLETEEPVSPLPLPLAAQGRPCIAGLLVVEAKAEDGKGRKKFLTAC